MGNWCYFTHISGVISPYFPNWFFRGPLCWCRLCFLFLRDIPWGLVGTFLRIGRPPMGQIEKSFFQLAGAQLPNQFLICSSFSTQNGYPLFICSSLRTNQPIVVGRPFQHVRRRMPFISENAVYDTSRPTPTRAGPPTQSRALHQKSGFNLA